jgi:hypothetical protein
MISGYPDKADILAVGRVIDNPDGTTMVTGWTMDGSRALVTLDISGNWPIDELRAIAARGTEDRETAG